MKLYDNLKHAARLLAPWQGYWAICGGIAACLYRETPRFTGDIDIALVDLPQRKAIQIAEATAQALGYKPLHGWVSDQNGNLIKETALIVGRESTSGSYVGIDFLLPVLPWIQPAVQRAQSNCLDYGFATLPTVTAEDLIIAKLFAFQGTPQRHQDLDDIESILRNSKLLNRALIKQLVTQFELSLPPSVGALLGA